MGDPFALVMGIHPIPSRTRMANPHSGKSVIPVATRPVVSLDEGVGKPDVESHHRTPSVVGAALCLHDRLT
ncbi:MAG: hypothetical protein AAGE59_16050 [Cyanobacteria bacterium P01_F01_bin.86]